MRLFNEKTRNKRLCTPTEEGVLVTRTQSELLVYKYRSVVLGVNRWKLTGFDLGNRLALDGVGHVKGWCCYKNGKKKQDA